MAIFTPLFHGERIRLHISEEDSKKITRGPGFKGQVTEVPSGVRWAVYGEDCGSPGCFCDAKAYPLDSRTEALSRSAGHE